MHATSDVASISTVAIDLAKDVFELACADAGGRIVEQDDGVRSSFKHSISEPDPIFVHA